MNFKVLLFIDKDNKISDISENIFDKMTQSFLPNNNVIISNSYKPDKINIIISDNILLNKDTIYYVNSFEQAYNLAISSHPQDIWVVGDKNIYIKAFSHNKCGEIYVNQSNESYDNGLKINISLLNLDIYNKMDTITYMKGYVPNGEYKYLQLLNELVHLDNSRDTRNAKTLSLFSKSLSWDLTKGFPLLTTKKMFWKGIVEELLFFINGDTNSKHLEKLGVNIWKPNTTSEFIKSIGLDLQEGDMGPIYGYQWRHWNYEYQGCDKDYTGCGIDQLQLLIDDIKTTPTSRRLLISTYNPSQAKQAVLYPCHSLILQFYVDHNKLSVKMYQRSCDIFLGCPFNIASTSLLLMIIAKITNLTPHMVYLDFGDVHLYTEHIPSALEQLNSLEPFQLPQLTLPEIENLNSLKKFSYQDFKLQDYKSHEPIKAKMIP